MGQLLEQAREIKSRQVDQWKVSRSLGVDELVERYTKENGRVPPAGYAEWIRRYHSTSNCTGGSDPFRGMQKSLNLFRAYAPGKLQLVMNQVIEQGERLGRVRVRSGRVVAFDKLNKRERGVDSESRRAVEEMLDIITRQAGVDIPNRALASWLEICSEEPLMLNPRPPVDIVVNASEEPVVLIPFEARRRLEDALGKGQGAAFSSPFQISVGLILTYHRFRFPRCRLQGRACTVQHVQLGLLGHSICLLTAHTRSYHAKIRLNCILAIGPATVYHSTRCFPIDSSSA